MNQIDLPDLRSGLLDWYQAQKRDLPWRNSRNPYFIWVSEVMLQQTQVKTVISYYDSFIEHFPDIRTLARADLNDILKIWEGLGYYARARNMHKAAQQIVSEYNGQVPGNLDQFRSLPGVGPYIGAAVLSIAFEKPYAVVDGNVKRVIARLMADDMPINDSKAYAYFLDIAERLLDRNHPCDYNQAIMEIGALVCTPRKPTCPTCPLNKFCKAFKTDQIEDYPKRNSRKTTPLYHIAVGVIYKDKKVLITRRKSEGLLGGLWEFPGGKIKEAEDAQAACIREIKEEINININVLSHLTQVKHAYTHFKIIMDVFCCKYVSGEICLNGPVDYRWIDVKELDQYPLPKANLKFIPKLIMDCKF